MLGFGLIMPLLPYFVAQYGGNAFLLGLLVASYAAAQFIGAPMLGRLSDRAGRRPSLVVSMAGAALGFVLLGLAEPIGRAVAPHEMGDALGTAGALESLSRMIAPTVGGLLLGALGAWAPGVLGAGVLAGLAAFAWRRLIARPDPVLAAA
jgi:DHA1 family tetracycline resistance protein-like MFS transporter